MSEWHVSISGERYGPISTPQLQGWISEGRVTGKDIVWREGMADWQPISDIAELAAAVGSPAPPMPGQVGQASPAAWRPHRGGTVLALGILAIPFACFLVFGILAWTMGKKDLAAMDAGQMDPMGRGITQAGKICGIVGVCVGIGYAAIFAVQMVWMASMMAAMSGG